MTTTVSDPKHPSAGAYVKKHWFWLLVNFVALLPLLQMSVGYLTGALGADPVARLTSQTGTAAIITLMASLACTPLNTLLGFRQALTVRKSLGLWAFLYAALHLLVFIGLDYAFDVGFILDDALLSKQYIFIGLTALLILLPLAITSTTGWMRRMGKNWKRLHKLVYAAGVLAVLHFFVLVKIDKTEPLIFAAILTVLLVLRIPVVRRNVSTLRRRLTSKRGPASQRGPAPQRSQSMAAPSTVAGEPSHSPEVV